MKKGFSLVIVIALTTTLLVIATAHFTYLRASAQKIENFQNRVQELYSQEAANILANKL